MHFSFNYILEIINLTTSIFFLDTNVITEQIYVDNGGCGRNKKHTKFALYTLWCMYVCRLNNSHTQTPTNHNLYNINVYVRAVSGYIYTDKRNITYYKLVTTFFFCLYKCSKALREELSYKSGISTFIRYLLQLLQTVQFATLLNRFETINYVLKRGFMYRNTMGGGFRQQPKVLIKCTWPQIIISFKFYYMLLVGSVFFFLITQIVFPGLVWEFVSYYFRPSLSTPKIGTDFPSLFLYRIEVEYRKKIGTIAKNPYQFPKIGDGCFKSCIVGV